MASIITADTGAVSGSAGLKQSADSSGVLALATGTGTTAVTIDASQNVGFGNTSPAARIDAFRPTVGTYFLGGGGDNVARQLAIKSSTTTNSGDTHTLDAQSGTGILAFAITGTERARIDTSGNLLVGTASNLSSVGKLQVAQPSSTTGNAVFSADALSTSYAYTIAYLNCARTSNSAYNFLIGTSNSYGQVEHQLRGDGVTLNRTGTYGQYSDVKLKENIVDANPKLNDLMEVRVVNYNLKTHPNEKMLGVIAQELESVFPNLVMENADKDADGNLLGTTTKSVKYSVFVPMLIKAIQEQQAIITTLTESLATLTARIEALENPQ